MTYSKKRRAWLLLGALSAIAASACFEVGDNTFGVGDDDLLLIGEIVVSTNTLGSAPDPDGYVAALDEARRQPIDLNGAVSFSSLRAGGYGVTLEGVASNCAIAGSNPVLIMLFADSTEYAHFDVTCN